MTLLDKFNSYLTPGRIEGVVLFLLSSLIVTIVHLYLKNDLVKGLKGANGMWDGPEALLYFCLWIFPPMMFAELFLQLHAPDLVWYTLISFVCAGLFGRWGLEWLLAFKGGANQVISTSTSTEEKKTVIKEEVQK